MVIFWIIISISVVFICIFILMKNTYFCEGGVLLKGCNKLLYPWTKKVKITKEKHCCIQCFNREMEILSGVDLSNQKPKEEAKKSYKDLPNYKDVGKV